MTCQWIETTGLYASDADWEQHLQTCDVCTSLLPEDPDTWGSADDFEVGYYSSQAITMPVGMVDVVMSRIQMEPRKSRRTNSMPKRNSRMRTYVSAAVIVIGLGTVFHTPVARAMTYVVDEINTTFFTNDAHPTPVKVTQVPPERTKQVEQDLLSPAEKSAALIFQKHRQEIVNTYKQLSEGQTHALRFSDGTAFMVTKQPVLTTLDEMKAKSTLALPVMSAVPVGLKFDEGSVRMNGMGTETAEVNMLYTQGGNVKQNKQFEYEKYTDPSFSLGKGNYISINMVFADGVLGTEFIGDFDMKQTVTVHGQPGVLMKYKDTWKPEPSITRLSFGVNQHGHHFMIQMDARGVTPDQLLRAAQDIQWEN